MRRFPYFAILPLFPYTYCLMSSRFLHQLGRYTIVGGFAAVLDISTFTILTAFCGVNHLIANTAAITLGLTVNYYLSSVWVFRQEKINFKRDFLPFAAIGIIGLGIQNTLLYLLLDCKVAFALNAYISLTTGTVLLFSKIFVTGVTFMWNFIARKYLVFENKNLSSDFNRT